MTQVVHPPTTLVWIDSREAVIVRWDGRAIRLARIESEVPSRRRSTSHVEHDPGRRPGGGGGAKATGEPHRLQHLEAFFKTVAERLPAGDRLELVGPGTAHERLASLVAEQDAEHRRARPVHAASSARMTPDQLRAWVRELAGVPPRRRKCGTVTGQALR